MEAASQAEGLIVLGGLLIVGLSTELLARWVRLPRVTLLIALGVAAGPIGLGLIPDRHAAWFPLVANMALAMVGFLLGEQFGRRSLQKYGKPVFWVSGTVTIVTALIVGIGLGLAQVGLAPALLLAGISTATAPAATLEVVHEAKATGSFTHVLLGVVAVDDVWGIAMFSLLLAVATADVSGGSVAAGPALVGLRDIGGAMALGFALGVPMAYLTGRLRRGEPTLIEALGFVFLCAGLALWLDVSFLLACVVLGATVANLARHHTRPFHALEHVEWPFLVLFFVLAGVSLELHALVEMGWLGALYVGLRVVGRLIGGLLGGRWAGMAAQHRWWIGPALLPQAGVAMGMALVAAQRFPEVGQPILSVVIASTVLFELLGPVATRQALRRVGELKAR